MVRKILLLFILVGLLPAYGKKTCKKGHTHTSTGLIIIDAQKWFIPGHPESLYELWGIKGHTRQANALIASMDSVVTWATKKRLPVFVTYEGSDTGRYDLPAVLKTRLDPSRTRHFVKTYYAATRHETFNKMIESSGIRNWIVIGAETDVCVYQTVKELLKKNRNVLLVKEALYSGRNNTEVAFNNLVSFGADTIHISDLYKGTFKFTNSKKKVEKEITYDNVVLTIFQTRNTTDTFSSNSDSTRLEYLKKYAQIIGIKTELITKDSLIRSHHKTRLVAGSLGEEEYNKLQSSTTDPLIIVSDCITTVPYSRQPTSWKKTTLKMVYYELMQTAAFYATPIDELEGWQKELKKALKEKKLDYVESSQNLY